MVRWLRGWEPKEAGFFPSAMGKLPWTQTRSRVVDFEKSETCKNAVLECRIIRLFRKEILS
jgi:hypothetical protein